MTVPDELIGIWKRESIAVAGRQPYENSDVYWLQTPSRYADIRVPNHESGRFSSFAGSQRWHAPRLRFHHELDLVGDFFDDEGTFHWDGETLIEDGTIVECGGEISFRERWVRQSVVGDDYSTWEKRKEDRLIAICISIGDLKLILDGSHGLFAQLQRQTASHVEVIAQVGKPRGLLRRSADWKLVEQSH